MQYVYMMRAGKNHYKIGVATNLRRRLNGLQTSNANHIEIVASILVPNANEIETLMHRSLQDVRADGGQEWFELSPEKAIDVVIQLSSYAVDVAANLDEKLVLQRMLDTNTSWKKSLEKKLDLIVNNYQKKAIKKIEDVKRIVPEAPKEVLVPTITDEVLYEFIKEIGKEHGRLSTSLVQRRLKIGYGRASRLIDRLELDGLVEPLNGAKARRYLG